MMPADRTYIIAEAGVNHNGDLAMAKRLIEVAAGCGADAVKFQTFKAEKLAVRNAPKADYQTRATGAAESQFDMIKKLELDEAAHETLIAHCEKCGIAFLSTPFDLESVDLLASRFDLARLKLPSGEITNAPLLLKAARSGKPLFLSTGMCTLGDIEDALGVLAFGYLGGDGEPSLPAFRAAYGSEQGAAVLREKVTLLHCTTEYPAPLQEVNLRAMDTMRQCFGLPVGFSDHTAGIAVAIAAAARGAVALEKHFTLDRSLPGPDHAASLEPSELKALVEAVRVVEQAMGSPMKVPTPSEMKNRVVARKSLVAATDIREGEPLSAASIAVKRPGTGVSPLRYWEYLGRKAPRDLLADEMLP